MTLRVTLRGKGFALIPEGAEGSIAYSNNHPTNYVGDSIDSHHLTIVSKTGTEMVLLGKVGANYPENCYLGAIAVGEDILWVNTTSPLPE